MSENKIKNKSNLEYKGKPLVRSGNTIYYGDAADDFVALVQILESKKIGEVETAVRVSVQIMATDSQLSPKDRMKKKTEKNGLYAALDIASIWLDKYLKGAEA